MLFTIVLWWVPAAALLAFLGCIIYDEWKDRTPDLEDARDTALGVLAVGWVFGWVIWAFLSIFATTIPSGETELVKTETYTVADLANFEYKENYHVKFISVDQNGNLEPQFFEPDDIDIEVFGGTTVVVETFDNYHRWINPWVMSTDTRVVIK